MSSVRLAPRRRARFGRWLLLSLALLFTTNLTGCRSTKPREHWWQFWRPKATATGSVYNPDTVVVPPADVPGSEGSASALDRDHLPTDLPPPPAGGAVEPDPLRRPTQGAVSQLQTVYFEYDSADLTPDAISTLDHNANWLQQNAGLDIQIEGHTDERGTVEYNLNLGDRRAKAVKEYLMSKGIPGERLHTISYGEERPIDPAAGETAFSRNRRAQFLLY